MRPTNYHHQYTGRGGCPDMSRRDGRFFAITHQYLLLRNHSFFTKDIYYIKLWHDRSLSLQSTRHQMTADSEANK
jgi:hypothetical protein